MTVQKGKAQNRCHELYPFDEVNHFELQQKSCGYNSELCSQVSIKIHAPSVMAMCVNKIAFMLWHHEVKEGKGVRFQQDRKKIPQALEMPLLILKLL